jgi:hypothetical protein
VLGRFVAAARDLKLGWGRFPDGAEVVYLYDAGDGGFDVRRPPEPATAGKGVRPAVRVFLPDVFIAIVRAPDALATVGRLTILDTEVGPMAALPRADMSQGTPRGVPWCRLPPRRGSCRTAPLRGSRRRRRFGGDAGGGAGGRPAPAETQDLCGPCGARRCRPAHAVGGPQRVMHRVGAAFWHTWFSGHVNSPKVHSSVPAMAHTN